MTKEQIEILEKYCQITKQEKYFGIVHRDSKGNYYVKTLAGDVIRDLAYEGAEKHYAHLFGEVVTIGYGTCGGACELGKPDENCIKNKAYSKNKCAVVFLYELNVRSSVNNLTYENLFTLLNEK